MTANIGIIGAGQIGGRHLQGLTRMKRPLHIFVYDPSSASLERVRSMIQKFPFRNDHRIDYFQSVTVGPRKLDAAIVATTADVRRIVIEHLLRQKKVHYLLLEKFLFQHPADYCKVDRLLKRHGVTAWVNCPLRALPFFKTLKNELNHSRPMNYTVSGSNIGIATNGIHHLDLAAFLSDEYDWKLDASLLDDRIQASKRIGFIELTGTLSGTSASGDRFFLTSYKTKHVPLRIRIESDVMRCHIHLNQNRASLATKGTAWTWSEVPFHLTLQSERTHHVIEQLLDEGRSDLPTYAQSSHLHLLLLHTFISHIHGDKGSEQTCPIT